MAELEVRRLKAETGRLKAETHRLEAEAAKCPRCREAVSGPREKSVKSLIFAVAKKGILVGSEFGGICQLVECLIRAYRFAPKGYRWVLTHLPQTQ